MKIYKLQQSKNIKTKSLFNEGYCLLKDGNNFKVPKIYRKNTIILIFSLALFTNCFSQTQYYSNFPTGASSHETTTADQVMINLGIGSITVPLGTFTNPQNISDANISNFSSYNSTASVITALGSNSNLLNGLSINVQADLNLSGVTGNVFNAGSVAGFLLDNLGGVVNVSLSNTITLSTYLNNVLQETNTTPSVTLVPSISTTAQNFYFTTTKNFNQVRVTIGSNQLAVNLLAQTNFYYAYGITQANVLPVSLTSFTAIPLNGSVKLDWVTETETNNTGFGIERSSNGTDFSQVDFVESKTKGSNISSASYTAIDASPLAGVNYYRLKQVDFDAHFTYSNTLSVKATGIISPFKVFPNPITNLVNIETGTPGTYVTELFTIDGRKVTSTQISTASGLATFNIDRTNISTGMYVLKITNKSTTTSTYSTIMVK